MDYCVQCWSNLRIEYFHISHWNSSYRWRRLWICPLNRPSPLPLVQRIASVGTCEQVHTSVLSSNKQKVAGVWELVKVKIQNLQSLLVYPKFFEDLPSLGDEWISGWRSWLASLSLILILLRRRWVNCSDIWELHGFNSCGWGAEEGATGYAKTFSKKPCVSQMLGGLSSRLGIPLERLSIQPRSGWGGKNTGLLGTWDCPLRIFKISRIIHAIIFIL